MTRLATDIAPEYSMRNAGGITHDAAGNLTDAVANPDSLHGTFDAENRQGSETVTVAGGTSTIDYTYDGEGRRVEKTVNSGSPVIYVYDGQGRLAQEYGGPNSTDPGTKYLTLDALGSTRLVTKTVNGAPSVVSRSDYLPFGQEMPTTGGGRTAYQPDASQTIKFASKERDAETGLDYFGARYTSSAQGRFISPDPITVTPARVADPQQLNLYAYGRNNPLKYVDPTGMVIDSGDLSDKDKKLWQQVVNLANKQDENGNYVNSALHSAYAALDSDSRLFKIEDNPGLGAGTAGQFTITKFNGDNDFSEARIDLNFKTIKGINSTTTGDFDSSFQKYSGLLRGNGFIPRLAKTFGHEANHGIFALQDLTEGTAIQQIINQRDAAMQALPAKGRYPLPPDVLQKMQAADKALVPTERFAQQAEKIINGELKASQVKK
jgi:RHS repeat-associated protein